MKKSWKRWMALAITGMLGIGALTGCTGGQAETGQTQEASEKSVDNQEEQQAQSSFDVEAFAAEHSDDPVTISLYPINGNLTS